MDNKDNSWSETIAKLSKVITLSHEYSHNRPINSDNEGDKDDQHALS